VAPYNDVAIKYSIAGTANETQGQDRVWLVYRDRDTVAREGDDPIAEWVNLRAFSLLEQFPPCDVLIMMEVARKQLMEEEGRS